jgi:thiosulfate sulfurtransferase
LIYCYHGNSSKSAANFFTQHGFEKVLSMDEGYSGWIKD